MSKTDDAEMSSYSERFLIQGSGAEIADDSGYENPYPETPQLHLATRARRAAHNKKWKALQEEWHKRQEGRAPCHFTRVPNELIMEMMYHMDQPSLKMFTFTCKRINEVWSANMLAIFIGMQSAQFPWFSAIFGKDPSRGSVQQQEKWKNALCVYGLVAGSPFAQHPKEECRWNHFRILKWFQRRFNAVAARLHDLSDGMVDRELTYRASLLCFHIDIRLAQIRMDPTTQEVEQTLQIFLEQPKEVQTRFMDMVGWLANKFTPRDQLEPFATQLEALEPEGLQYKSLEQWLLKKIFAFGFHFFRCHNMLFTAAEGVSIIARRYYFHELLNGREDDFFLHLSELLSIALLGLKRSTLAETQNPCRSWKKFLKLKDTVRII